MNRVIFIASLILTLIGFSWIALGQESKDSIPKINCETVFALATEMPEYPLGGETLAASVNEIVARIPCKAERAKAITFVVSADGKMKSPVFMPGNLAVCSSILEEEFSELETWTPGRQAGNPVCVNVTIPLR